MSLGCSRRGWACEDLRLAARLESTSLPDQDIQRVQIFAFARRRTEQAEKCVCWTKKLATKGTTDSQLYDSAMHR